MPKCLILGANGFLGSHLVDVLLEEDCDLRLFDRFSNKSQGRVNNSKAEIFVGDFLNRNDLREALKGVDYVFHFISTTTPASAENDPEIDIDTNIRMSVALFQECVQQKIKKVIFASTGGSIYGDTGSQDKLSESTLPAPVSPYAIGKLTIEHYLRYFHTKFGLNSVTYRISNPYGDRQSLTSKQGVIPIFLQRIANKEPITVLGDGTMVRDYIYVQDVARMITASFKSAKMPVYNLGSGQGVSLNELIESIREVTKMEIKIIHSPKPLTYVQNVILDTTRFENEFNIKPQIPLEEGLRMTWDYINRGQGARS